MAGGGQHHPALGRDVDDAVRRLDGHPTQLDVLGVRRAHPGVLLDGGDGGDGTGGQREMLRQGRIFKFRGTPTVESRGEAEPPAQRFWVQHHR